MTFAGVPQTGKQISSANGPKSGASPRGELDMYTLLPEAVPTIDANPASLVRGGG